MFLLALDKFVLTQPIMMDDGFTIPTGTLGDVDYFDRVSNRFEVTFPEPYGTVSISANILTARCRKLKTT